MLPLAGRPAFADEIVKVQKSAHDKKADVTTSSKGQNIPLGVFTVFSS